MEPPAVASFRPIKPVVLGEPPEQITEIAPIDSPAGRLRENRFGLLPWLLAAFFGLGIIGSIGYWLMDHFTSKAAIAEINQHAEMTRATPKFLRSGRAAEKIQVTELPLAISPGVRTLAIRPDTLGKLAGFLLRLFGLANPNHADTASSVGLPPAATDLLPMSAPSGHIPGRLNRITGRDHPPRHDARAATPPPAVATTRPMKTQTISVRNPTVPGLSSSAATITPMGVKPDLWARRYDEAMLLVQGRTIFAGKRTIGNHAKQMLSEMHEKELLHAADMGERLYLPDKMGWSALQEGGPRYRVYLNFSALQANGERAQARSYQFMVNLETHEVSSDDTATLQDFLENKTYSVHVRNPMADAIESVLSAVDLLNKQKMRAMIIEKGHRSQEEQKNIHQSFASARAKLQRQIIYFRTKYVEKILSNIAKAYAFQEILKKNG